MSSQTMISWRPNNVIQHLPWKLDSKAALGFLLILATFSLVGWLYLTQASAVTTTSYRIDELRLELDQLRNQNAAIALEIAQLQALSAVENRAWELGFRPTANIRYLAVENYPVAQPGELIGPALVDLSRVQPGPEGLTLGSAAWWTALLDEVAAWLVTEY
jgi:hypothetical protein